MNIKNSGIEEAEMYVRFANLHLSQLYQQLTSPEQGHGEHTVAAAQALLHVSQQILQRVIKEQYAGKRAQKDA